MQICIAVGCGFAQRISIWVLDAQLVGEAEIPDRSHSKALRQELIDLLLQGINHRGALLDQPRHRLYRSVGSTDCSSSDYVGELTPKKFDVRERRLKAVYNEVCSRFHIFDNVSPEDSLEFVSEDDSSSQNGSEASDNPANRPYRSQPCCRKASRDRPRRDYEAG